MFILKKIISPFIDPATLALILLVLGLILLFFTRRQKAGQFSLAIGTLVFGIFSCGVTADYLLKPLEYAYRPLPMQLFAGELQNSPAAGAKWIVVLGGGVAGDDSIPITSRLGDASIVRLAEGIRLHKKLPRTKLVFVGGKVFGKVAEAEAMAELARDLGIRDADIIMLADAKDTKDSARSVKDLIGKDRHVLVTSAVHMPRSVALFRKQGLDPVPAPTDHEATKEEGFRPGDFFPGGNELKKSESAVHEYLGTLWARLRGQI